jgi:programmed cell death 6-interacting protein
LIFSATPKLSLGKTDKEMPWDLTEPFLKSLEWLMLAQAQECIWQMALSG